MYLGISARLKLPSLSNHSKSYHVDPYLMCTLISHPYTNNVYSDWSSRRTNQILPLESISNQPRANNSPLTKSFSPDVTDRGFRFQRATKTWIRKRQPFKMSNEKWSSLGTKWHKKFPSQFHQLYNTIIPKEKLSSCGIGIDNEFTFLPSRLGSPKGLLLYEGKLMVWWSLFEEMASTDCKLDFERPLLRNPKIRLKSYQSLAGV